MLLYTSLSAHRHMLHVYSPGDGNFLREMMAAILKYNVKLKIGLHQSTCIYLKNNPVKFHPDLI